MPKTDIAAQGYGLSLNRYKELANEAVEYRYRSRSWLSWGALNTEIAAGLAALGERMAA